MIAVVVESIGQGHDDDGDNGDDRNQRLQEIIVGRLGVDVQQDMNDDGKRQHQTCGLAAHVLLLFLELFLYLVVHTFFQFFYPANPLPGSLPMAAKIQFPDKYAPRGPFPLPGRR